jgi:hypothetical protein
LRQRVTGGADRRGAAGHTVAGTDEHVLRASRLCGARAIKKRRSITAGYANGERGYNFGYASARRFPGFVIEPGSNLNESSVPTAAELRRVGGCLCSIWNERGSGLFARN